MGSDWNVTASATHRQPAYPVLHPGALGLSISLALIIPLPEPLHLCLNPLGTLAHHVPMCPDWPAEPAAHHGCLSIAWHSPKTTLHQSDSLRSGSGLSASDAMSVHEKRGIRSSTDREAIQPGARHAFPNLGTEKAWEHTWVSYAMHRSLRTSAGRLKAIDRVCHRDAGAAGGAMVQWCRSVSGAGALHSAQAGQARHLQGNVPSTDRAHHSMQDSSGSPCAVGNVRFTGRPSTPQTVPGHVLLNIASLRPAAYLD